MRGFSSLPNVGLMRALDTDERSPPTIKENPMTTNRISRLILVGAVGAAGLGTLVALPVTQAGAAASSININARCSGTSVANLQVQREDTGKLSVDFGVDMARHTAGVPWRVTESNNGSVFVSTTTKTISDGSFSISRLITPKAGTNTVVGKAVNLVTHETCKITGSL